ncbi:ketoacyl-ACP synthase III [Sphingobacterium daejeonense]|uniref:3-oxoacyl-ACP synthase III family protein n=1 Tax=Sphingobacterium daejeonense TaxID=371142 RepID=UPI0021A6B53B|nr:ketoacyl-ACP synthase III [Sphingobacterium daejeonense]MCT1530674.1 ketoacyl-ACP synthase III [Sphingobacterium daejeonense]
MLKSKIIATGAYIPTEIIPNENFLYHTFYDADQKLIRQPNQEIIRKFKNITGISERRYAEKSIKSSDMASIAAKEAIMIAGIDPETIDQIIVAHNYGDIDSFAGTREMVPSLASKVKHNLGIKNTKCIPYDLIFGCPGWLQGVIHADLAIRANEANTCLIIGVDTLSRILDPTDRDSMIFSDGAGACILQKNEDDNSGILITAARSHSIEELDYISSGGGNCGTNNDTRFIKMKGRKVYEYALTYVPQAMKECFDASGENIENLKMVFIHQANEKMDEAIASRFFELYGINELPANVLPMNISTMGNSSVATIPTLLHQVLKGEIDGYSLEKEDLVLFASVGAGMNINAACYRV